MTTTVLNIFRREFFYAQCSWTISLTDTITRFFVKIVIFGYLDKFDHVRKHMWQGKRVGYPTAPVQLVAV